MREQWVRPGAGIDPVELGSTVEQARVVLAALGEVDDFRRADGDPPGLVTELGDQSVFVHASRTGVVIGVEASPGEDVRVLLDGVDVFRTPADEVVERLRARYVVEESEEGCSYAVPALALGLWRSAVPDQEDSEDDEGRYFESVLVGE